MADARRLRHGPGAESIKNITPCFFWYRVLGGGVNLVLLNNKTTTTTTTATKKRKRKKRKRKENPTKQQQQKNKGQCEICNALLN